MNWLNKLLILLVIFVYPGASLWAATTIEAIGGSETVAVKREGKEIKLKKGDELKVGDEVITGKSNAVDLRFPDKTLIRVGANSQYKLEEDSNKLIHRFFSGIIRVLVPPKKDGSGVQFRMSTPEGTIGVRGTEFVVIRSLDQTTLKGLEGEVLFGKADQNFGDLESFILVKKGYESSVKKGGAPAEPKSFSLPSYLREIDIKGNGAFGALADRNSGKAKSRSAVVVADSKPSFSLGSAPKKESGFVKKAIQKPIKVTEQFSVNEQLIDAAAKEELEEMAALLKKGAEVNYQDENGISPLLAATYKNKIESVKYLLKNGANPNIKDAEGNTPLIAVAEDSAEAAMAFLLVENKADINEKNKRGFTALDYAREKAKENPKKYEDILPVLQGELKKEE
jgi:hypothetical protein